MLEFLNISCYDLSKLFTQFFIILNKN
jgi:hypothetical protein